MVTFNLQFNEDEMCDFFKAQGFKVAEIEETFSVKAYHNRDVERNQKTKCVLSPTNGKAIPVAVAFEDIIHTVAKHLLLSNISKLDIVRTFNIQKNGKN